MDWEEIRKGTTLEEKWNELKELVYDAMIKTESVRRRKRKQGYKDWWNRNCTRKKRMVYRIYKRWQKGKIRTEIYIEEKRKMKKLLKRSKEKKRREEEKEIRAR